MRGWTAATTSTPVLQSPRRVYGCLPFQPVSPKHHISSNHTCQRKFAAGLMVRCQASEVDSAARTKVTPVPRGAPETAEQALAAAKRAWADGISRQRFELLLPLIGATDLDDWPGGVRQQFKAVLPMVEAILKGLKAEPGLSGPLNASIWDQGDAVGAWQGDALAAVVFPTAETLKKVRDLAANKSDRLLLMINPQWQAGQVISDFGLGRWRQKSEDFIAAFEDVYFLKQFRMVGENVRLLRSYPGQWQVHVADAQGQIDCIALRDTKPSYKELEELLNAREGSLASLDWVERLRREIKFNNDSLKGPN